MSEKTKTNQALAELDQHKNEVAPVTADAEIIQGRQSKSQFKYKNELAHAYNYIDGLSSGQKQKVKAAVKNNEHYFNQKILELSNLGLTIADKDYYIIAYGDNLDFPIDYKGMLKVASMEARKAGFQLIPKADTIRKGFTKADVITNGMIDNIVVENGKINEEILTAYAIVALLDLQSREIVMQKVEILPISEYQAAKSKTKSQGEVYKEFGSEMAKKIAFRRALKVIKSMFASDALDQLFANDNDSYVIEPDPAEPQKKLG
jgi:recombinational DNA repair protein RecT